MFVKKTREGVIMKFGIYYSYWETEWGGDAFPYIKKVKELGFDLLEVACGDFDRHDISYFHNLRNESEKHGIALSGGYGPRAEHNITSTDSAIVENAFSFYREIFPKMQTAGIKSLGGAIYSYWPVDFSSGVNKPADLETSIKNMKRLADLAAEYDITLNMEALNRFEGYLLNTARETVDYVDAVAKDNVKVMLDTFHMNIEEDCFINAITLSGEKLGELHVGEANRRAPRPGRMPWGIIGEALRDINFKGNVVMEPFVLMGGQVGKDISVWRNLEKPEDLDRLAAESVEFLRSEFLL